MKIRDFVLAVILLFIAGDFAIADRQLDQAQILQIFQTLTDQPRNTWIPAGTIKAKHLEYKASSGYVTESTVIVKYDGDRFYWEINIDSHTRQTQPQAAPDGKSSFSCPRGGNSPGHAESSLRLPTEPRQRLRRPGRWQRYAHPGPADAQKAAHL